MPTNLVIITEDGPGIGLGHAMRCLAMAQACKTAGGIVIFATAPTNSNVRYQFGIQGRILDYSPEEVLHSPGSIADKLNGLCLTAQNTWFLVDGYNYTQDEIDALQQVGYKVAKFSDAQQDKVDKVDLIISPHLYTSARRYNCPSLCGVAYAPIRRGFLKLGKPRRNYMESPKRVLVSLGGYANLRMVHDLVYYLSRTNGYEIVITGVNRHDPNLRRDKVRVFGYLHDMPQIMAWADFGIVTTSVTCYEALYTGLPLLGTSVAQNQDLVLDSLLHVGACSRYLNEETIAEFVSNGVLRNSIGTMGAKLIDGNGGKRILNYMEAHM